MTLPHLSLTRKILRLITHPDFLLRLLVLFAFLFITFQLLTLGTAL